MAGYLRSLRPGDLIGDKYAIVQPIGTGGMGIVYEATHARLGQRVAIKMLLPDLSESPNAVARFEREARAAAHLRSPHVARVFDVDTMPDGTPYIVMELLEGRDLADELAERGALPVGEAVDYMLQVCDAMAEAHRHGIVHRDLKPANLFLAENGRGSIVKVLDFGISKVLDDAAPGVTTTRSGLGTASYMSPEQVRSAKNVDARGDVWALGVVLYEMLTGAQPFPGDSATAVAAAIVADRPVPLRSLREDVPFALEQVVMTALEKDRENRFADAAALASAMAPFASRRKAPSSSPSGRSSEVGPTLHSAVEVDVSAVRPHRSSKGGRSATWTHPRNLWIPLGVLVGVTASAALLREMSRETATQRSSASSNAPTQVLVPPSAAMAPVPSETEVRVTERGDEIATPSAPSAQKPQPASIASSSKSESRTAPPASPSHSSVVKETAGPASSTRGNVQKTSHGLPPDPG